jgi:Xaa-Pro aminopeptidase
MDQPQRRRQKLCRPLKKDGLGALLVSHPLHVTYLTGFTGDSSFLVLTPSRAILVSDDRYAIQIQEECPGLETDIRGHDRNTYQAAAAVLNKLGVRTVGFEARHFTVAELQWMRDLVPGAEWSPQYDRVEHLRAIKDPSEIEAIRQSVRIAERAFGMLRMMMRGRDTEKESADALEMAIRRAGGSGSAFPLMIQAGERSALPHGPPTDRALNSAAFLLIDWGAKGPLYQSDLTRMVRAPDDGSTIPLKKRRQVESELAKLYTTVLSAQRAASAVIRDGVSVKEVDAAARKVIGDAGLGDRFTHGLGHGIGLQTHEAPSVRGNSDDVLRAGMVTTLEPGVYLPGFGGVRVEDDFLVTRDGCERLSVLPQEWEFFFEG